MKSLRNKVILSGIVLLFAFIATIGSTYAWFTVSSTTEVAEMNLNVKAEENLLIRLVPVDTSGFNYESIDPADFKTSVTIDDLTGAGYLYDDFGGPAEAAWQLLPVTMVNTTYNGFNAKALNYMTSIDALTPSRPLAVSAYNDPAGRFIQLKFILLSQASESKYIELSQLVIDSSNGDARDDVVDAVRVSMWFDDTLTTQGTPFGEGPILVYGRDTDFGYTFAGTNSAITGANTLSEVSTTVGLSELITTGAVIDIWDETFSTNQNLTTDLYTLTYNVPALVTVNIFVEGWDVEATNFVIGAAFSIAFGFTIGEQD